MFVWKRNKKILLVNDNFFIHKMISKIALENGYELLGPVADENKAAALYAQFRPQHVIMDISVQNLNWIMGIRAMRSINLCANIIILADPWQQQYENEAHRLGAGSFVLKPFDRNRLAQAMQTALRF